MKVIRLWRIVAVVSLFTSMVAGAQVHECIRPDFLTIGDTVAVVAPSFAVYDTLALERSCNVIRSFGLVPVLGRHIHKEQPRDCKNRKVETYSGTMEQRLEDFMWAYNDKSVKAIICARGGYGAIHLVDKIPFETYTDNLKWLVGYSDITTFLSAATCAGVMSVHGPMCGSFGSVKGAKDDSRAMFDILFGKIPQYDVPSSPYNVSGHAEGMLVGGNAITFGILAGTEYDPARYDDIILFIEEVGESMHALDRFFSNMELRGLVDHVKGIIVGDIVESNDDMAYLDAYRAVAEYTSALGIPVSFGLHSGHGKENWPLLMGAKVSLDVDADGSKIRFDVGN